MKHTLIFFLFVFASFTNNSFAQGVSDPTQWKWYIVKLSENLYEFRANVQIKEGWHLFDVNPGGDGFLIPTTVEVKKDPSIKEVKLASQGKLIHADIEGIKGKVNFYENEAVFVSTIKTSKPIDKVSGTITYQSCNDKMCLPPVDINFEAVVKHN